MKGRRFSQKALWRMKHAAQTRDRDLLASGKLRPEEMHLLRSDRVRDAQIEWPRTSLRDPKPSSKRSTPRSAPINPREKTATRRPVPGKRK